MTCRILDERVSRAVEVMESSGGGTAPGTCVKVAALAGISASHSAHLFRQQAGMAPLQMLRSINFRRAEDVLRQASLPVKEIARPAGFHTSSAFTRAFRGVCARRVGSWNVLCKGLRCAAEHPGGNQAAHYGRTRKHFCGQATGEPSCAMRECRRDLLRGQAVSHRS